MTPDHAADHTARSFAPPGGLPRTLTARSPEDVLAAVPLVLGFVPEDSIAMLTFEARHAFHARLDLPTGRREREEAARVLVEPAVRHEVRRVFFVLYTDDPGRARACARTLLEEFARHDIDVVDVLRSDDAHWFPVSLDRSDPRGDPRDLLDPDGVGVPYALDAHLFTVQAVSEGRVTLRSRGELAATVAPDDAAVAEVAAAAAELAHTPTGVSSPQVWARSAEALQSALAAGSRPPARETAGLLLAIREPGPRDAVLRGVDRAGAEQRLPLWSALVRAAPPDLVAAPASVLAFLAWLAGHGALAWCALDRAIGGEPPCSLAACVAEALEQALPPSVWKPAGRSVWKLAGEEPA